MMDDRDRPSDRSWDGEEEHAENTAGETDAGFEATAVRGMKKQYNRIGWAIVTAVCVWQVLMLLVGIVMACIELVGEIPAVDFYYRYLLIVNELSLAVGILVGAQVLRGTEKWAPEKRAFSAGHFLVLFLICYAMSFAGNLIGNLILGIWNALTGRSVGSEIADILADTDPVVNLVTVGIMAPVLEELFMRKFVIDRTRAYGERVCILTSAVLFALFHMNFSQMFYAFGIGVLLAYLYCRSGKIWLCMLLHAMFNCFSGVLGTEISKRLMEILNPLAELSEAELLERIPELIQTSGVFLLLAFLYYAAVFVMVIAGIVLFIVRARRYRPEPGTVALSAKGRREAIVKNPGMIAAVLVFLGFTLYSLFV